MRLKNVELLGRGGLVLTTVLPEGQVPLTTWSFLMTVCWARLTGAGDLTAYRRINRALDVLEAQKAAEVLELEADLYAQLKPRFPEVALGWGLHSTFIMDALDAL